MNKEGIINASLRLLARNTISGLTDSTAEARVATALYDVIYDECLSGHPWSFAKLTTAQLSASPNETPDEREVYPLPAGWLMLTKVYEGDSSGTEVPYEVKGNSVVTDWDVSSSGLYVDYIKRPSEGLLPGYFTAYLVKALAAGFALPLTENNSIAENWAAQAEKSRRTAVYNDTVASGHKRLADEDEYSLIAGR